MKNFILLVLLFILNKGFSQDYYSKVSESEDYIRMNLAHFSIGETNYVVSQEYCVFTTGDSLCSYIHRIDDDGNLLSVVNLGDIQLQGQCSVSDSTEITIVGKKGSSTLKLIRLDHNLNILDNLLYELDFSINIFSVRSSSDAIYVSSRDLNFPQSNDFNLKFFKIKKDNYELVELENDVYHHFNTVSDFELDNNNELCLLSQTINSSYILKYDTDFTFLSKQDLDFSEYVPYLNIAVLNNNNYVLGLRNGRELICYDSDSINQLWLVDLAASYAVTEIRFLRQMKQLTNGDILLCGSINFKGYNSFICRLSQNGTIIWKRIFKYPDSEKSLLLDFSEHSNGDLSFYGMVRLGGENWNSFYNQYWTLKIDSTGCLAGQCGNVEIEIVDFDGDGYYSDIDCNDNLAIVNPGAVEVPGNGLDDDCNEDTLDFPFDMDNDGYNSDVDCDDETPDVNPGPDEIPGNGLDDDCNEDTPDSPVDMDNDGFYSDVDCDDNNDQVNPGQIEIVYNGFDDDCDESTLDDDLDMDGFNLEIDCDDDNPNINPLAEEIPYNGIDENCDGLDEITTSVEQVQFSFKVYPNPFVSSIFIELAGSGLKSYDVHVFDLSGRKLVHINGRPRELDLSSLMRGVYVLSISNNESRFRKKIVKL